MGNIAINQENISKYTDFFKELYNLTNSTQYRPVTIINLCQKHSVDRGVVPRAIELKIIDKQGDKAHTKYKWIGQYPEPIMVRRILQATDDFCKKYKKDTKKAVKKEVPEKIYSTSDANALETVLRLQSEGYKNADIGKMFGVGHSAISKLVCRKRKELENNINTPMKREEPRQKEFIAKIPDIPEKPKRKKVTAKQAVEPKFEEVKVKVLWGLYSYTKKVEV